jgi:hypothetical protein
MTAEIVPGQLEAHYHRTRTEAPGGDCAPQRAAVILALVAGTQMMRRIPAARRWPTPPRRN